MGKNQSITQKGWGESAGFSEQVCGKSYLMIIGINCAPETTKSNGGVAVSLTEDSPSTVMSCVPRIPSMTFITESGSAGITLSATMASGSSSTTETYTRLFTCCLLRTPMVE